MNIEYSMELANGQGWNIIAANGSSFLVEKMASIMELEPYHKDRFAKLIFTKINSLENPIENLDDEFTRYLPHTGWKYYTVNELCIWYHDSLPHIICGDGNSESYQNLIGYIWQALHPIYFSTCLTGGIPIHGGLAVYNGIGVLFSGPGDVGKSTCCRRLPHPWQALSDDETLVVRDSNNKYMAHPFPTWSEHLLNRSNTTWNVQRSVPLKALFFLEQSKTDEVIPIGSGEASVLINQYTPGICTLKWNDTTPDRENTLRKKRFENACNLAKTVPAFLLRLTLTGCFWEEIEKVLPQNQICNCVRN